MPLLAALPPVTSVERPPMTGANVHYGANRAPLRPAAFVKLPTNAFRPEGWLKKALELQRDGLMGNLGEISVWLTKKNNAWLNPDGKGDYGWEEVPYWLRGYARVGYALRDPKMMEETRFWVEGTLKSQRADGDFGPIRTHGNKGARDVWGQMLMVQVLQGWYEETNDERVLPFLSRYFKWELAYPEDKFLKDYWENSRGGDNLASVYWLYNRTGEPFLLDLATKIDRNTANWRMDGVLPNWHNVNIAECFREPALYSQQSGKAEDLAASYRVHDFVREKYGQVPGGMFGSDENARPGHDDPHQGVETCGMVEQIYSNGFMAAITGDPKWPANTEDVAFNTLPAAFMPDYRALRYLVAPNMGVSDGANHAPGIANAGPFLLMNPFSSRCCQHNHSSSWVNYLENTWMATNDNGLAVLSFAEGEVTAKVANNDVAQFFVSTKYPFEENVTMTFGASKRATFPLYILIPEWANGATAKVAGQTVKAVPGQYLRLDRTWKTGETVALKLPMKPRIKTWDQMRDSVSVMYGPLTFSLKIEESYRQVDGTKTAQHDAGWQPGVDQSKWLTHEILPSSPWNYGLPKNPKFEVVRKPWPTDDNPFTLATAPIELRTTGHKIPTWTLDQHGLVGILPKSPVEVDTPAERITLVPMGAARLRISSFPTVN